MSTNIDNIILSAHYLDSLSYNHELANKFTEKAVLLVEECKKDLLTHQEELTNNISIAYWNRATYYNKSNNNNEAIKYWIQYLELLDEQELNNNLDNIKFIINACISSKRKTEEEQEKINKLFNILSTKHDNTVTHKLFNEIVNSNLTLSNIKSFLSQISIYYPLMR